tara:strand:+ start:3908 stop:4258 length:351 start_codon:yes stop_codon:yes gene_type:complete
MKKRKLKQLREIADAMPLDITIDKNGFPTANCRYRQMKKIYRIEGEDAVIDYCKSVMNNIDKINADNLEINRIVSENLTIAQKNNEKYLLRSRYKQNSFGGSAAKRIWRWLKKILK